MLIHQFFSTDASTLLWFRDTLKAKLMISQQFIDQEAVSTSLTLITALQDHTKPKMCSSLFQLIIKILWLQTLNIFNPLFPRNEEHDEVLELSFNLSKKLKSIRKEVHYSVTTAIASWRMMMDKTCEQINIKTKQE